MSNRLTFSLASLTLIFVLAFVATPVMAADGGPVATITEYSGADDPNVAPGATNAPHEQERTDFRLLVTFDVLVSGALADSNFEVVTAEAIGKAGTIESTTGIGTIVAITLGANAGKAYMVPVNFDTLDSDYSQGFVSFAVNADAVTGNQSGHATFNVGNVKSAAFELTSGIPKNNDWTFTPTLGDTADDYIADDKLKTTKTFEVDFAISGGTGAIPDLTANASQIQLKNKDGDVIDTTSGVITAATPTQTGLNAAVLYTVGGADVDTPVTVGINPNWASGSTLRIPAEDEPAPPDKEAVDPVVDISPVGTVNEAAMTFEVKFTFAEATVDAATQTANAVPADLMAGDITIEKEDPSDPMAMIASLAYVEPNGIIALPNSTWLVTINYRLDALPLYVGTGIAVSATTIDGTAPGADDPSALMVGDAPSMNNAPVFTEGAAAARSIAEDAAVGANVGAAVTATDADTGDTLTYSLDTASDASFDIDSMGQITTAVALDFETTPSYTVTVSVSDGTDSASITVTITVTDVDEAPPNMDPVFNANLPATIMGKSGVAITPVTFTATDSDGGTLAYSWDVDETALGLMLSTTTGTVSGTPLKAHSGSHPITVMDGQGGSATHPLTITITGNAAPAFAPFTFPTLTAGTAHPVTLPGATDADGDALTYSIRGTLPAGLMASSDSSMPLTISGAATAAGTASVTYVASDGRGGEATLPLTITVNAAPETPKDPPPGAPGAPNNLAAIVNDDNSVTLTWTEPTGPITGYDVGITVTGATTGSTSRIVGRASTHTTAVLTAGAYTITVAARNNAGGGGSASVTVTIAPTAPPGPTKTPVIDIPTVYDSSGPIALGSQFANPVIPAHGWAVLVRDINGSHTFAPVGNTWIRSESTSLPDLELFFGGRDGVNSGTVSLHQPAGGTAAADDIVISEIMWGVDSANSVDSTCSQWIEFYNTTTSPIDLTGWEIKFHRSLVDERNWTIPTLVDIASNAGVTDRFPVHKYHHPWAPKGQSGLFNRGATGVNIVSMFLEINYTQAGNVKHVVPSGADVNAWSPSVYPQSNLPFGIVATPGAATEIRINYTETPVSQKLIINEIGNGEDTKDDWIEIYNPTDATQNTENMRFTTVTYPNSVGTETILFRLPKQDIPAKHYVVFAASDPKNRGNDLAAGIDITKSDVDQKNKGLGSKVGIEHQSNNTTAFYRVHTAVNLPDTAAHRLYILRAAGKDHEIGANPEAQKTVVDVVGSLAITLRNRTPAGWTGAAETERGRTDTGDAHVRRIFDTTLWPLQWAVVDPGKKHPHGERVDGGAGALGVSKVYQRNGTGLPNAKNHLTTAGYTGVGYDRWAEVNSENHGTPGYSNGAVKADKSNWNNQVSISEIMLSTHESGDDAPRIPRATRLPQWIEIFNNSLTEGVNLGNWYLEIRNADSEDLVTRDLHGTLRLPSVIIPPNQTVLIVSSSGLSSPNFPEQRVINLFTHGNARNIFSLVNRNDPILSQVGFYIQLRDHKNNFVDEVGNLPATTRRGLEARGADNFTPVWDLPVMNHPEGPRTSLIRIYDDGIPNDGMLPVADLDMMEKQTNIGWRRALDTTFRNVPTLSYYGNQRDYGTPGYRGGGPLPVSLSKFRPERLDDGSVVIRWVTESELNNAGFNILRSDTRDGDYTKVNKQLILGNGTTTERSAYEWKDTSAKPNVVYYYQIQDVSIDGKIQTLRVSRLKGNVTAAGKATTTWGELKALQ